MKRSAFIAMLMVLGLLFAACGEDTGDTGTDAGAQDQAEDTGDDAAEHNEVEGGEVLVTAVDYEFDLPDTLPAGTTTFTLKNDGKKPHFIDIVPLVDGAPPVDKLIKMPQKKAESFFAGPPNHLPVVKPGETGKKTLEIELESGARYGYVCFISDGKGKPPHAFLGMAGEFSVE